MKFKVFCLSCVLFITLCASQDIVKKCNVAYRCSFVLEPVWTTTDNKSCQVFQNGCLLASENCNRQNHNKPEARDIGQEKCQELCKKTCCPAHKSAPICGYYLDEKRNFGSRCEMEKHNCSTGKPFSLYKEGLCPV